MNKWAETDAWRVRWVLHGHHDVLPWSLLTTIPAKILDERAAQPMPLCFAPLRDATNTVWVQAAYQESQRIYSVQLHSPRARDVAAAIVSPVQPWLELFGTSWPDDIRAAVVVYRASRFGPIRQILQQLPEPPW